MIVFKKMRTTFAPLALLAVSSIAMQAQTDFPTTVASTHPIAFYRLDSTSGQSLVGTTTYQATGSASIATSGAPVATANSRYLKLDGKTAYITTTQMGGVGTAASLMAWVNLAELPSKTGHLIYVAGESEYGNVAELPSTAHHIFYVTGESENGNDLDLQFETDNILKFFTASGGNLPYKVPPDSLIGQWHQIVATLDTPTHTRVIYWDGKAVATDKGGGEAGKKNVFTLGESSVFRGRYFHGSIDDAGIRRSRIPRRSGRLRPHANNRSLRHQGHC